MNRIFFIIFLFLSTAVCRAESNSVLYAAFLTGSDSIPVYKELTEYISKRLGAPLTADYSLQSSQAARSIALKEALLGFIGPGAYVSAKSRYGLDPVAAVNPLKGRVHQSMIIVPADSKASTLADLKGRNFAFTELDSYSGRLSVIYILKNRGLNPKTFFSKVTFTGTDENSIKAVAEKTVDGATVDNFVLEHISQKKTDIYRKVKVIESGEKTGSPLFVTSKFSDKKAVARIRDILFTMHKNPAGIAILRKLDINNFLIPNLDAYRTVENHLKIVQEFIP